MFTDIEYIEEMHIDNSFKSYQNICHIMMDFSDSARILANMALANPIDMVGRTNSPKQARGVLFRKMQADGHNYHDIWEAFREVKAALR